MDTKQKVLVGAAVASTAAAGAAFAFKSAGTDSKLTKVACPPSAPMAQILQCKIARQGLSRAGSEPWI